MYQWPLTLFWNSGSRIAVQRHEKQLIYYTAGLDPRQYKYRPWIFKATPAMPWVVSQLNHKSIRVVGGNVKFCCACLILRSHRLRLVVSVWVSTFNPSPTQGTTILPLRMFHLFILSIIIIIIISRLLLRKKSMKATQGEINSPGICFWLLIYIFYSYIYILMYWSGLGHDIMGSF